jgi:hypothetical protein
MTSQGASFNTSNIPSVPTFDLASQTHDILESFERDGFVVLKSIVPLNLLKEWQGFADLYWKEIFATLLNHGHISFPSHYQLDDNGCRQYTLGKGIKNGFREIVMRSPGRYELSLRHLSANKHPSLEKLTGLLSKVVPSLLNLEGWDDLRISNLSLIVSTPGSLQQSWHADGGHLSLTEHLSCHCMNIFIPLVEVTEVNGPTEFRPGTHFHTRNLTKMMLAAKARKTLRTPVAPLLSVGDVVMFDYRVLHRGQANVSTTNSENRTILCLTVSQPWFKDVLNYPTRSIEMQPQL